jgi:pimeloyl-ACP methyl ester carboxylesterase
MRRALARTLLAFVALLAIVTVAGVRCDRGAAELEAAYATPPSRFVDVDGLRMHYRDRGTGPALVLLHGSAASLFTWEGWASILAHDHRVISVDLPGHGLTGPDARGRYSPQQMADLVDRFTTTLGLTHFDLAGNSMGGGIAFRYALAHPEKVDKLVLVDASIYPQEPAPVMKLFRMPVIGRLARWVTPRFMVAHTTRALYGDRSRVSGALIDQYLALLLRDGNREAMRIRMSTRSDDGAWKRTGELHVPTMILWGSADKRILPANGERAAREIPGARIIVLDGLGHMPMEEDPQRSAAPVAAFLAEKQY